MSEKEEYMIGLYSGEFTFSRCTCGGRRSLKEPFCDYEDAVEVEVICEKCGALDFVEISAGDWVLAERIRDELGGGNKRHSDS